MQYRATHSFELSFFMPCHVERLGVKYLNIMFLKPTGDHWMHWGMILLNFLIKLTLRFNR